MCTLKLNWSGTLHRVGKNLYVTKNCHPVWHWCGQKWVRWWSGCKTNGLNRFQCQKHGFRVPTCHDYWYTKILNFSQKNPTVWHGCGQKLVRWWSECKTNSVNRFPVSNNMGVEYPHVMVINMQRFSIFHKNSHGRKWAWPPWIFLKELTFITLVSSSTYLAETFPVLKPWLGICSQMHFIIPLLLNWGSYS